MSLFTTLPFILSVSVLALTSACSRRATCAMEGCTKNGSVVLATDFQSEEKAAQDADAVVDDGALEKDISDLKARMELNESVTKLLGAAVEMHEKRIAALEDKSNAADLALKDVSDRVTATESSLTEIDEQLAALDLLLNGSVEESAENIGLIQQIADLRNSQMRLYGKLQNLKERVKCLEHFRKEQESWNRWYAGKVKSLSKKIGDLKDRMSSAEANFLELKEMVLAMDASLDIVNGDIDDLQLRTQVIEDGMATDDELLAAKTEVLTSLRGEILESSDTLEQSIDDLTAVVDNKCEFGEKKREGLLWYRYVNCGDGKTLKFLIL